MSYRGALDIEMQVRELERSHRLARLHESSRPAHQASRSAPVARRWIASALRGLVVRVMPRVSRKPARSRQVTYQADRQMVRVALMHRGGDH